MKNKFILHVFCDSSLTDHFPARRVPRGTGVCSPSPCCRPPLMEMTALSSVVSTVVSALLGCAVPIDASSFRTDRDGLSSDTGPRHLLKRRVHPRVSLVSPPEFVVSTSALIACATSGAFLGVSFLVAASIQRVHSR
jgi:hypothetical protein